MAAMRNPFSVDDVPDPVGADVEAFAANVPVRRELDLDENAVAWVAIATAVDGIDGAWSSRWRSGDGEWQRGVATLHKTNERVFILYKNADTYLIEAAQRGERLVGRSINLHDAKDTSPWVGHVVNPYRIDGYWRHGRWDLRRCSPDEQPEPIVAAVLTEARRLAPAELRELLGFARYLRWRDVKKPDGQ
jgi:hypothetical protein